jgi:serine/threonine protein kinase
VHSELVIAGKRTRAANPLADRYPVHFLKSYHPWSFHGNPRIEFENNQAAAQILGTPEPIGFDNNSFRAPFIPGKPLSKLSPFTNIEPPHRCLGIAQKTEPASLIGLWRLIEEVFEQIEKLHAQRFCHGDLELHNIVVCTVPVQTFLVDFESSERAFPGPDKNWEQRRSSDLFEVLRLAVYLRAAQGAARKQIRTANAKGCEALFDIVRQHDPVPRFARFQMFDRLVHFGHFKTFCDRRNLMPSTKIKHLRRG